MKQVLCTKCGTVGYPKTVTKGSLIIEIILWLFLLLPGLIYSVWRLTTRYKACRSCGSPDIIPPESPAARKILAAQQT